LIDPSSFAPPPKNVNYYGAAATERQVDRIPHKGPLTPAEYQAREKEKADRENEEAAREKEQRRLDREAKQSLRLAQQGEVDGYGPRSSYTNDSTGLSTTQFAPPVARSTAVDGTVVIRPTAPRKPALPPRLPDRQNSSPRIRVPSPPPTHRSAAPEQSLHRVQLSPGSLNRLAAAGVSGSGIGISSQEQSPTKHGRPPQVPSRTGTGSSLNGVAAPSDNPQLSELQSRFASMRASSPHSEQIATGWKSANTSNRKYGASDNAATYSSSAHSEELESPIELRDNTVPLDKKAPPPRPKKKAELSGISTKVTDISPPIPLSTKPR
jgi:hypothetical protein